jgi:hypothetical protein
MSVVEQDEYLLTDSAYIPVLQGGDIGAGPLLLP